MIRPFVDTNVVIYALQSGPKSETAMAILVDGGVISVQVLNETAHAMRRKFATPWPQLRAQLAFLQQVAREVRPLTEGVHLAGLAIAERDRIPFYDALILAAALEAGCDTLLSEDFQAGRRFGGLTVVNPFAV
jgi:predicted nucleic acid-binding protein